MQSFSPNHDVAFNAEQISAAFAQLREAPLQKWSDASEKRLRYYELDEGRLVRAELGTSEDLAVTLVVFGQGCPRGASFFFEASGSFDKAIEVNGHNLATGAREELLVALHQVRPEQEISRDAYDRLVYESAKRICK